MGQTTVSGGEASPNGLCTVVARERPSTDRRDVRPFFKRVRRASPLVNALSAFAVWRGQRLSPCLTHAYIRLRLSIRCHRTRHIFLLLHGLLLRGLLLRGLLLRGLSGRSTSLLMGGHRPPQTPLSLRFPHPSMSQNGTSATTLLRINLRHLHEQLTQDGGDLGHLGTGGVFGTPAAGE